jgi:O-antigen/teichoic acid export membrane protein
MGIIKRQAIGYSLVNYLGIAVGSLSTLFLYPRDEQAYGLFRFLLDGANILQPFAMLGAWYVGVRMFPIFKNEKNGNNGLWMLLTSLFAVGSLLLAISFNYLHPFLFSLEKMKDAALFQRYLWTIIPLFIIYGYFVLSRQYASNFLKVVYPSFLDQLIKISFPLVFILYLCKIIDLDGLVLSILVHFTLMIFLAIFYLKKINALYWTFPKADFLTKEQWKSVGIFALYGAVGSGSSMLALRLDTFMITALMGDFKDTGKFSIASLIGSNIAMPLTAIATIASPIISKAWNENNLLEIKKLYQKSSENLLLVGMYLFGGVLLCIYDLFALMPKHGDFSAEITVVYIVGLKSVIDMATGANDMIIGYSKKYAFNLVAITVMAIINIFGNLYFIPRYGIIGAAISTFISSVMFNFTKFLYIKVQFGLMPYTFNTLKILFISILSIVSCFYIPNVGHPVLNILLKGGIFTILIGASALYFDVSEDITFVKQQILKKLGLKK